MSLRQQWIGKKHAVRTLWMMGRTLCNWREVWVAYKGQAPLPPLRFRAGFVLNHGAWDDPIALLYDVFSDSGYTRYLSDKLQGTMLDIGANVGLTSLDFATSFPGLQIDAYEPNPATADILSRNISESGLSDRIRLFRDAVGQGGRCLQLWTNVPSVSASAYGEQNTEGAARISVPVIDLNEAYRRTGSQRIAFLKIDAEGAEAEILENASPSTLAAVDQVALEYHEWLCPKALSRCSAVLVANGFELHVSPAGRPGLGMLYATRRSSVGK